MLFNSFEFLIFLPIVFSIYWFLANKSLNLQNGLVLIASYFFYGWWSWPFLLLLFGSTVLDYFLVFLVASENANTAKWSLRIGVFINLGILGVYKYYNFFIEQFQVAFDSLGVHTSLPILKLALPIGISFYTFHGLSYVLPRNLRFWLTDHHKKIIMLMNLLVWPAECSFQACTQWAFQL